MAQDRTNDHTMRDVDRSRMQNDIGTITQMTEKVYVTCELYVLARALAKKILNINVIVIKSKHELLTSTEA